jgi:hypothetical protein
MRWSVRVGLTEIVTTSVVDYLCHCVVAYQNDWVTLLLFAEFAYNKYSHESTGSTPFNLNYGFDPNLPSSFEVYEAMHPKVPKPRRGTGKCPGAEEFYKKIQVAIQEARINLEGAQQRQKAYADTKRREVKFNKGDLVLLSTANLHIKKGSTRKLAGNGSL